MTRASLHAAAAGFGVVVLLAFVVLKTQSLDFQEHSRYQAGLVHLKELDGRLNADVLESRFELTSSYDALVATLAELEKTQTELGVPPGFVSAQSRIELGTLLASHTAAVHDEAALVERFKSENAILRNTLHYLPIIYAGLTSGDAARRGERAPDGVNDIVRDVLLFNLTGDAETARSVTARLDDMTTSNLGDGTPAAYQLRMLAGHVGIVLNSKVALDGLLAQMVSVPTLSGAEALEAAYSREYDQALDSANLYRSILVGLVAIFFSCTVLILARLRRATSERRRSEARRVAILASALDAIVLVDATGAVTEFNPAAEHTFGYSRDEAIGKLLTEMVISVGPGDSVADILTSALLGQHLLGTGRRADGTEMPLELAIVQIDFDAPPIFTAYLRDISERHQAEQALQHQAHHDGLTSLPNRTLLHQRLQDAAGVAQQAGQLMAVLVMDLDRFKEVNDTLGHHAGDELLRQVAQRLQSTLRAGDTVARMGGDEFAVLLPGSDMEAAQRVAAKLLHGLSSAFLVEGRGLEIGASIGIAVFPEHGTDAETLLRRADVALYAAKREGCGLIVYNPNQDDHLRLGPLHDPLRGPAGVVALL
jgi:diguanylate cyclase (GGDEF)-like protein/PAS domain S-box-containing protein